MRSRSTSQPCFLTRRRQQSLEGVVVLPGGTLSGNSLEEVQVIGVAEPSLRFVADGWETIGEDPLSGWEQHFVGPISPAIPLLALSVLTLVVLGVGVAWALIKRGVIHRAQDASEA